MAHRNIRTISLEVTKRCPLRCIYCYNPERGDKEVSRENELSAGEWKKVIRKLPRIDTGVITGGEPFVRKDVFEIARELKKKSSEIIILTSCRIMDRDTARRIRESGLRLQIQISALSGRYDELTGRKGAFRKLEKGILTLTESETEFSTSLVLTKRNVPDLPSLLKFHSAIGSTHVLVNRYILPIRRTDPGDLPLGPAEYVNSLRTLDEFTRKTGIPVSLGIPNPPCVADPDDLPRINTPSCTAGKDHFTVNERGELKICPHKAERGPSVTETGFAGAMAALAEPIERHRALPESCEVCEHVEKCGGGCRSRAIASRGKKGGRDPLLTV